MADIGKRIVDKCTPNPRIRLQQLAALDGKYLSHHRAKSRYMLISPLNEAHEICDISMVTSLHTTDRSADTHTSNHETQIPIDLLSMGGMFKIYRSGLGSCTIARGSS
jgi:hypothetical protein